MSISGRRPVGAAIAFVALVGAAVAAEDAPADLALGIRQARDGEFESALVTLDAAVRRLMAHSPPPSQDLAQGWLHIGVSYLGLGQEQLAQRKFRQALRHDLGLRLSPDQFSKKVIRSFEAARASLARLATLERESKRKPRRGGAIVLAAGGAAAGGIAAVTLRKERANTPPAVTPVTIRPSGRVIPDVTVVSLSALGTDAEGDALRYTWEFGDGATADGAAVSHVFPRADTFLARTFAVRVSVYDGIASTNGGGTVEARSMAGVWRVAGSAFLGITAFRLNSGADGFYGLDAEPGGMGNGGSATFFDPRTFVFQFRFSETGLPDPNCFFGYRGEADANLTTLQGILECRGPNPPFNSLCPCHGQQQSLTLTR